MAEQTGTGRLQGKTAIVTGAAMGLGEAIAHAFAREGAHVACLDREEQTNASVAEAIRSAGGEAVALACDVSSARETQQAVRGAVERLGRIDILVNNAGVIPSRETVVNTSEEDWDKTMNVNAKGCFLMSKAVIPHMVDNGGGAIVNMSSITGLVGLPVRPAYCASKGAVSLLTRQMAVDFGGDNIRVNAINPSFVITAINKAMFDKLKADGEGWERMLDLHPLRFLGEPRDVAAAAIFLASEEARWITGVTLPVDGGYTAR